MINPTTIGVVVACGGREASPPSPQVDVEGIHGDNERCGIVLAGSSCAIYEEAWVKVHWRHMGGGEQGGLSEPSEPQTAFMYRGALEPVDHNGRIPAC